SDDSDCDDDAAAVHPGATEICNGIDDGVTSTFWADADGDGYGDPASPTTACSAPSGHVADDTDCDDTDGGVYPGADEHCDGVDEDCDGAVDEAAVDALTWYDDLDGDGYGDSGAATVACTAPSATVATPGDCDDRDGGVHPGAAEHCDGVDEDCDGVADDSPVDADTWYTDADGDGYGDPAATTEACIAPSGTVADDTDCDDGAAGVNPGAAEVCDGLDDDCDGLVDDADGSLSGAPTWYLDHDADGYGTSAYTATRCTAPSGYIAIDSDCDDLRAAVHPGAAEVCDGLDDDCDGLVDDDDPDVTGLATWYADSDGDGYGDAGTSAAACTAPTGYVAASTDCDDGDASVSPGATEVCGGGDEDCDGLVDDADPGVTGGATWYLDYDGDGWGDTRITTTACLQPSDHAASAGDCDDLEPDAFPGNTEVCDGIDNDCDSLVDDDDPDIADALSWYADADADGFGAATSGVTACDAPTGYVADDTDCDDADASSHPSATERYDGADNDCDGDVDEDLWVGDGADGDLTVYGTVDLSTLYSGSRLWADAERVQVAAISGDTLTVSRTPWGMASGDEVLLINLQGSETAHAAVGTYEFATVDSVSGTDVVLAATVTEVYGETDNSDLTDQIIILQRVPHYADVTVFAGGVLTTDAWDASAGGGVLAFRASGTVYIEDGGTIDVSALGYAGGDTGTCENCDAFQGESYTGVGIGDAYGGPYNETIGGYAANGGGGGANVTGGGGNHAAGATYGDSWNYGGYTAPSAGGSYGVPSLVTLFFGSGGGGVWNGGHDDPTEDPGPGGSGAGILYLGCGTLVAEGADALQAVGETTPYWAHGTWTYGAGGGAGGSVFLVAEEVDLAPAAVNAEGGFGESTHLRVGGDGGYGRVRIDCNTCNGYAQGSGLASIALDDAAEPDPGYSSSPY
ncbi:MAG: putative metal-binding motif-containing protein, partial [Pseudomonadota bacterium]